MTTGKTIAFSLIFLIALNINISKMYFSNCMKNIFPKIKEKSITKAFIQGDGKTLYFKISIFKVMYTVGVNLIKSQEK